MIPQILPLLCAPLKLSPSTEGLQAFLQVSAQEHPTTRVTLLPLSPLLPNFPPRKALSSSAEGCSFPAGLPCPEPLGQRLPSGPHLAQDQVPEDTPTAEVWRKSSFFFLNKKSKLEPGVVVYYCNSSIKEGGTGRPEFKVRRESQERPGRDKRGPLAAWVRGQGPRGSFPGDYNHLCAQALPQNNGIKNLFSVR